ncbi:MAG TPA: hypothetical protein VHX59_10935 [Mycobacteriales bacterium]|nr:hypothetical protein [Mycobacteriales bacterium]
MTEPIAARSTRPPVPGLSHPALRWVRATCTDLDAEDYSRMTLAERFQLWTAARVLAQSAGRSRIDRRPA